MAVPSSRRVNVCTLGQSEEIDGYRLVVSQLDSRLTKQAMSIYSTYHDKSGSRRRASGGRYLAVNERFVALFVMLLFCTQCLRPVAAADPPSGITDLTAKHCISCHGGDSSEGNLDLSSLAFELKDRSEFALWVKIFDRVTRREMPPKDAPQPAADESARFSSRHAIEYLHPQREFGAIF